jgi:hypothetical protein
LLAAWDGFGDVHRPAALCTGGSEFR